MRRKFKFTFVIPEQQFVVQSAALEKQIKTTRTFILTGAPTAMEDISHDAVKDLGRAYLRANGSVLSSVKRW